MNKNYLFFLFSFLVLTSWSQKVLVMLEVEPSIVSPNEEISVKVTYNISGEVELDWPEQFNRNYSTMRGSKIMNDYTTGSFIQQNYVSYSGSFSKAGTYTLGPAFIKRGNKIYKSNSASITVRNESNSSSTPLNDISSKQLNEVSFGVISASKTSVYEGEPVVLEAKIYSKYSPTYLESYKSYSIAGISEKQTLQKSSNNITVKEEFIKNKAYYAFGYDKKVVFLNGPGEKEIDPFELTLHYGFQTKKVESSNAKISVKALPEDAPASFTGGVGSFSIKRQNVAKKLKQGDVFSLLIEISGTGNLQQIAKPVLDLGKNFTLYGDPIIKEDFIYSSLGAEGKIRITYNIQVIGKGKLKLPEILFSYFDPSKEKYVELKTGSEELNVEANTNFQLSQKSAAGKSENFKGSDLNGSNGSGSWMDHLSTSPILWSITALPLLLGFLWFFGIRKKQNANEKVVLNSPETTLQNGEINDPAPKNEDEKIMDLQKVLDTGDTANFYRAMKLKIVQELRSKYDLPKDLQFAQIAEEVKAKLPQDHYIEIVRIVSLCEQGQFGLGLSELENDALLSDTSRVLEKIKSI